MEQQIQELLNSHSAWKQIDEALVGNWRFANFGQLREAVGKLCDLADELNHHPTVTYGYNTLTVETTTHDASNTITEKDVELAQRVSEIMVGE